MSEMSKKARSENRAKVRRYTTADPHQKVDASSWTPPEPLRAGRKVYDQSKLKTATAKIYKLGGKVQGDRGPRRRDKSCRGGSYADGGVPTARFIEQPTPHGSPLLGGSGSKRGGAAKSEIKAAVHKHEKHDHKGEPLTKLKHGGEIRTGNKSPNYLGGTRPTGGRIARANGGKTEERKEYCPHCDAQYPDSDSLRCVACGKSRTGDDRPKRASGGYSKEAVDKEIRKDKRIGKKEAENIHRLLRGRSAPSKRQLFDEGPYQEGDDEVFNKGGRTKHARGGKTKGKTNIVINVGGQDKGMPPMLPPQAVVRPPPGPPPMPPGPPSGGPPPGMAGGPPIPPQSMGGPPGMPRRRGGSALHMTAGAGSGEGRLQKSRHQARMGH